MEKPVAVIEVTSKNIKFVAGYTLDDKVYVIYTLVKKIGNIVENGRVVDFPKLIEEIKKMSDVYDKDASIKIKFSEAIIILPPFGIDVFQAKQMTSTVSEVNKIGNIDIRNVYSLIRKSVALKDNNQLVDIISDNYILDHDRYFIKPPIGESSSALTILAKVHVLPKNVYNDYYEVMIKAGLSVKRTVIAPFAAAQAIFNENNVPKRYILADVGSNMTTVSLIGGNQIYNSVCFNWGGDKINDALIEKYNLSNDDAEKYKCLYGLDSRKMSFDPPICAVTDENGQTSNITRESFYDVIKTQLDNFVSSLNIAINQLSSTYENANDIKKMPMILIGGGSLLNGLKDYIEHKIPCDSVEIRVPTTLGARNPGLYNCLGAILVHSKYPAVYDEAHPKVNQVTRNPK